jgi:DNA-binding NtrC family response regulator
MALTGRIVLGRANDCDLRLQDEATSRHHASVELSGEKVMLRDLGSANGTWVGGVRVSEVQLVDGGRFKIGSSEFVVKVSSAKPVSPDTATPVALQAVFAGKPGDTQAGPLAPAARPNPMVRLLGGSPPVAAALDLAAKAAPYPSAILICGPYGSGKELIARLIHEQSPRSQQPFVMVNCSALSEARQERELFGYPGATQNKIGYFKLANGGTLFLEEAGALTMNVQEKVSRTIEAGEIMPLGNLKPVRVDVRIIVSASRDPQPDVEAGVFHRELYRRLSVTHIDLPSLAERPADVRPLVQYYLARKTTDVGRPSRIITEQALDALERYSWPGNIRELCAAIERALAESPGAKLDLDAFPPEIAKRA